jgi:hypothetical protein
MKKGIVTVYICVGIGLDQFFPSYVRIFTVDKNPIVHNIRPKSGEVSSRAWKSASSFSKAPSKKVKSKY